MPEGKLIFISFASADRPIAERACQLLEASGTACWIAPRDIEAGRSYPDEILRGLRQSRMMLLFYSKHVRPSPWVLREVERAVAEHLTVLPVLLDSSELAGDFQFLLGVCQWLNTKPSSPDFFDAIVSACQGAKPIVEPPPVVVITPTAHEQIENLDDLFRPNKRS